MHVTNMMVEARDWVKSHFPYWDRRGGRDHIWLMNHDEGACYAPTDIYRSSIFLTHWGRTDLEHESNTAFTPDNYTQVGRWVGGRVGGGRWFNTRSTPRSRPTTTHRWAGGWVQMRF
jgi:hypothetical protein